MKKELKNKKLSKVEKICGFNKSAHFLYREWDRKISPELLKSILSKVNPKAPNKTIFIIGRRITVQFDKSNRDLFLIIHKNILVTYFFDELRNQLGKKVKENYILISQC
jgi:hypothetical protein